MPTGPGLTTIEDTINLMINFIQTNIPTALSQVRNNRTDSLVTTEVPRQYFTYAPAHGYSTPSVFVICEEFDFRPDVRKANFIDAVARINVAVLVEDKNQNNLTIKAWRYMDAMRIVLEQAEIVDTTNNVKLIVILKGGIFSPEYSNAGSDPQGVFRKEVHFECLVEHYSNF